MPLPLIPLALWGAGLATGAAGLVNGAMGATKMNRARDLVETASSRYERDVNSIERAIARTNDFLNAYGRRQEEAHEAVVQRMTEFLRRNEQQVRERAALLLDGIDVEFNLVAEGEVVAIRAVDWVKGASQAGVTGAAAFLGIPSAVSAVASASTGTAIKTLSGAAAKRATLAWLGGGAVSAGGGGMAAGVAALNVVTVGPTLLVAGLAFNGRAEKALTQAQEYETEVEVAMAENSATRRILKAVAQRTQELHGLLDELTRRAIEELDELEAQPFDADVHQERFQAAFALVVAVRDLVATPILLEDGSPNAVAADLLIRYREMA